MEILFFLGNNLTITIIILIVAVLLFSSLRIIQQSEVMIIERLGKYKRTITSGINIIIPILEKPRGINRNLRIDLRESLYDFPEQGVITKDNVNIKIDAVLYCQIVDPIKSVYGIADLPNSIEKLSQTTLRNLIGELELDEVLSSRDTINTKLRSILDGATDKWGVKVTRVELQNIVPPEALIEAMEKQMRAERDRRAAILEAEGSKKSKILEAEGFRESEIKRSEGKKEAEILRADGEAQAKIKLAEAEAKSIEIVTKVIDSKRTNPINYLIASKYIKALQNMVTGKDNKTIYIPYEATGILSSIGGIKDLFKNK